MKRKPAFIILGFSILTCIIVAITAHNYYGLAAEHPVYRCKQHDDDTLRLAIIGDSWAFLHHDIDASLAQSLSDSINRPVNVSSYGLCGQTSKEVYRSMFEDEHLRQLLESGPDYCFVSVGINDTYKKTGAAYYAHHTWLILHFLLQNGIIPILMEIPNYDIRYAYEHQTTLRKLLRQFSMLVTGSRLDCREEYRQTLRSTLKSKKNCLQIILPSHRIFNTSSFLSDGMHLNAQGYSQLDSCIISEIIKTE